MRLRLIAAALSLLTCSCELTERSVRTVTLQFRAVVDGDPIVFDELQYANPGGEGQFKVRSFLFYLSNVKLIGEAEEYVEADSYHLVRFDNADKSFVIELADVPIGK